MRGIKKNGVSVSTENYFQQKNDCWQKNTTCHVFSARSRYSPLVVLLSCLLDIRRFWSFLAYLRESSFHYLRLSIGSVQKLQLLQCVWASAHVISVSLATRFVRNYRKLFPNSRLSKSSSLPKQYQKSFQKCFKKFVCDGFETRCVYSAKCICALLWACKTDRLFYFQKALMFSSHPQPSGILRCAHITSGSVTPTLVRKQNSIIDNSWRIVKIRGFQ